MAPDATKNGFVFLLQCPIMNSEWQDLLFVNQWPQFLPTLSPKNGELCEVSESARAKGSPNAFPLLCWGSLASLQARRRNRLFKV